MSLAYENQLPLHYSDDDIVECDCCGYDYYYSELDEGYCSTCLETTCHECGEPATETDYDEDTGVIVDCCENHK